MNSVASLRSGIVGTALAAALVVAVPAAAVAPLSTPARDGLQAMRELNLVVLGDMQTSSQVEGKAFIAGNLTGSSSFGSGRGSQGATPSSRRTLTVGGNLTANINLNNGPNGGNGLVASNHGVLVGGNYNVGSINGGGASVDVGGNISGNNLNLSNNQVVNAGGNITASMNGSNASQRVNSGGSIAGNANGAIYTRNKGIGWNAASTSVAVTAEAAKLTTDLSALSQELSTLSLLNNPSSFVMGGQGPIFTAVNGGNGFALFNIAGHILNSNEIAFTQSGGPMPIIINVSGTSINWRGNSVGGYNASLNPFLIWNFYEATDLTISGAMKHGSILAPLANLITNGVDLEGSIVAKNFNQSGQVHLGTYAGGSDFLAEPIPEPSSWAMLVIGFGLIGGMMRRRTATMARAAA